MQGTAARHSYSCTAPKQQNGQGVLTPCVKSDKVCSPPHHLPACRRGCTPPTARYYHITSAPTHLQAVHLLQQLAQHALAHAHAGVAAAVANCGQPVYFVEKDD